jgi:hypothetical protein
MTPPPDPSDPVEAFHMAIGVGRVTAAALAVLLLVASAGAALAEGPEAQAGGVTPPRLSYVDGQVSYWRPGAEDWIPAQLNMALAPGDQLHTGRPGNVELQVGPRAFVRAWGDTQLVLVNQTPDLLHVHVTDGHVAVDVRALDAGHIIRIDAPGASFTINQPGYHRVDVDLMPQRATFTTRRPGHATITRVEAGATRTSTAPEPDAWDRWNQARTDEVLYAQSTRYVPEGVYGVHDLDQHGDWRVLPTYGAVWVPRGSPAGWAPYTTGRWFWDPRFGWTWVDTAAWGWAPYHYGRWVYLDGIWAWAPGPVVARPVYAPALVAFFSAPGVRVGVGAPLVSWVALGWGEPVVPWWGRPGFIGRPVWAGWGGPRIVNNIVVHRTTVVHATDIRVYRNARVHRAVVAVHPERFGRARVQDVRVTEIDTRRLEPVRGPLRAVPDAARRGEPAGRVHRTPDAERSRPDGARPQPRSESPAPSASPVAPAPAPAPRIDATPRGPQPAPGVMPPAGGDGSRERRGDSAARRDAPPHPEPLRAEPGAARRETPASRVEREGRPDMARPRVEPSRPQIAPPVEPSRPTMRPRVERSRPPQRDAADHGFEGRREPRESRRAAPAASPTLKGAASHERQDRGGGRDRAR